MILRQQSTKNKHETIQSHVPKSSATHEPPNPFSFTFPFILSKPANIETVFFGCMMGIGPQLKPAGGGGGGAFAP